MSPSPEAESPCIAGEGERRPLCGKPHYWERPQQSPGQDEQWRRSGRFSSLAADGPPGSGKSPERRRRFSESSLKRTFRNRVVPLVFRGLEPGRPDALSWHMRCTVRLAMQPAASSACSRLQRVLVAEDDDDVRFLLCDAFRQDGYAVDDVEDGHELSDYLERCSPWGPLPRPDVVVSDIHMPGKTGLEVLAKLKANDCRIVLITAFANAKERLEGLTLGATAILYKPLDLDLLLSTVRSARRPA